MRYVKAPAGWSCSDENRFSIEDGLGVRDGLHLMKVHRRLPLEPYLLAAIGLADLDPVGEAAWTLRSFVERTNAAQRSQLGGSWDRAEGQ